MGTVILIFGNDYDVDEVIQCSADSLKDARKEANYWVSRRWEKSRKECTKGFYAEHEIDVTKIIADCEEQEARYYREQQEKEDRENYERLKRKYEA